MPQDPIKMLDSAIETKANDAAQATSQYDQLRDSVAKWIAELMTDTYTRTGRFVEPEQFMDTARQHIEDTLRFVHMETVKHSFREQGQPIDMSVVRPAGAKVKLHLLSNPEYGVQDMIIRRVKSDAADYLADKKGLAGVYRERGPQNNDNPTVIVNGAAVDPNKLVEPETPRGEMLSDMGTGAKTSKFVVQDDDLGFIEESGKRYQSTRGKAKKAAKKARHLAGKP